MDGLSRCWGGAAWVVQGGLSRGAKLDVLRSIVLAGIFLRNSPLNAEVVQARVGIGQQCIRENLRLRFVVDRNASAFIAPDLIFFNGRVRLVANIVCD